MDYQSISKATVNIRRRRWIQATDLTHAERRGRERERGEGGMDGGRDVGWEEGRDGGRDVGWEEGREGERDGGKEGRRREAEREREREREREIDRERERERERERGEGERGGEERELLRFILTSMFMLTLIYY